MYSGTFGDAHHPHLASLVPGVDMQAFKHAVALVSGQWHAFIRLARPCISTAFSLKMRLQAGCRS